MTAPWIRATPENLSRVIIGTGVFEIREPTGEVIDIGFAGALEPFGLRSALDRELGHGGAQGLEFRYEPHVLYMSRFVELVLDHKFRNAGEEPVRLRERGTHVPGRIRPA
ncbi:hypothetical protein [Nocardioides terrisoli]|uniref:hypothetical protein n=1 Tax=Nocardioides terrisoli TaxID=3388267 RepID=UPI00287B8039|nr:hypothetical protein [Nocardioides marmorisolisilvae]